MSEDEELTYEKARQLEKDLKDAFMDYFGEKNKLEYGNKTTKYYKQSEGQEDE